MERFRLIAATLFLLLCVPGRSACLQYASGSCLRCDSGQHLNGCLCMPVIANCASYSSDNRCLSCAGGVSPQPNGSCPSLTISNGSVTLFTLAFGQASFKFEQISLTTITSDTWFMKCDSFVRNGEYGHFISRATVVWQSVSVAISGSLRTYRIIYYGSGGGIMLCVIKIDVSIQAILLQSLVTIDAHQMVDHCLNYNNQNACDRCQKGYHLETGLCYNDIAGCVSYFGRICMSCQGWALLVENRCQYDCHNECDSGHLQFVGDKLGSKN